MTSIFCDWHRNKSNIKGKLILLSFRIANLATKNKVFFYLLLPHLVFHRIIIEWILGIELPWKTVIGEGLIIYHGYSLVINDGSVIGKNCTLRHCTTIGNKQLTEFTYSKCPTIGDNVDIGSNVCIIGPVNIGSNVKIGAGSVIVKDVPSNCVVVGNPARIIKQQ